MIQIFCNKIYSLNDLTTYTSSAGWGRPYFTKDMLIRVTIFDRALKRFTKQGNSGQDLEILSTVFVWITEIKYEALHFETEV